MLSIIPPISFMLAIASPAPQSKPVDVNFKARFGSFDGCFVLKALNEDWTLRYNENRCAEALSPCSTFKVFNALAGLDAGVVDGPEALIKWDGSPQRRKETRKDHTLATAIRDSVVWYFQEVARRIGSDRMKRYLDDCDYGNRDISTGIDRFWLQGSLMISANQQVDFLQRLYTDRLPFKQAAMQAVKRMIIQHRGKNWTFSGKTGSGGANGKYTLGWFVGHVEHGNRQFVFAVNIREGDRPSGAAAKKISMALLKDLGLIGDDLSSSRPDVAAR